MAGAVLYVPVKPSCLRMFWAVLTMPPPLLPDSCMRTWFGWEGWVGGWVGGWEGRGRHTQVKAPDVP